MRNPSPISIDRLLFAAILIWAAGAVGLFVLNLVQNPTRARRAALDDRIASVTFHSETFETPEEVNYRKQRESIMAKQSLWKDLVAPPPKPVVEAKGPDLNKFLEGIIASAREEIVVGETVKVKFRTLQNKSGRWLTVGDKINGMTIAKITPEEILFTIEIKGKEYTAKLKRE